MRAFRMRILVVFALLTRDANAHAAPDNPLLAEAGGWTVAGLAYSWLPRMQDEASRGALRKRPGRTSKLKPRRETSWGCARHGERGSPPRRPTA